MIKQIFAIVFISFLAETYALHLSIYYEALCPDSRRFIVNQLNPSYGILKSNLDVEYLPYGNAETRNVSGQLTFTCQHGPNECYGNRVQACAIKYNEDQDVQTKFIVCAMDALSSDNAILQQCADDAGISWDPIEECLSTDEADLLHAHYGELTDAVQPPISWVPTVIFEGVYNSTLQYLGEHHFLIVACELLEPLKPEGCPP